MKKVFCLIIVTLILVTASFTAVFAGSYYSDVENDFWASSSIYRWTDESVIKGYNDKSCKPNSSITRAEFVTMISRVFLPVTNADLSRFEDMDKNAWYYDAIAKAVNMGIIKGVSDTKMNPEGLITREEAMTILARLLALTSNDFSVLNPYYDSSDISDWARDSVAIMVSAGYVNGYTDGTIKPSNTITRAETAKILDRTFSVVIREEGTYNLSEINGNVVIAADNVIITAPNISGKIYLSEQVKIITVDSNKTSDVIIKSNNSVNDAKIEIAGKDKGSSSSSIPTKIVFNIDPNISGDAYVFSVTSNKSSEKFALGYYLTIKLSGDVVVDEFLVTRANLKTALSATIDELDNQMIKATCEDFKDNPVVRSLGIKVLLLNSHTSDDYSSLITNDNTDKMKILAAYAVEGLSVDDLTKLANAVCQ